MRRAAYWLVPLIAFAVALFIGIFLVQINPAVPKVHPIEKEHTAEHKGLKDQFGSWINRLSGNQEDEYFYPVNEVTLHLDMGDTPVATTLYRLSVKPKNSDELLQIKEVLKNSELPYDMDNKEENKILTVDSSDKAQLQSLVTKLKNYQISATLSPYTEEK